MKSLLCFMKKLVILFSILFSLFMVNANAQQAGTDPGTRLERFKEKVKPQLIEKTKITEAEADKVIAIYFSYSGRIREANKMTETEKLKLVEELRASEVKEYSAIPLSELQIKAVTDFFVAQRKQAQK